MIVPHLGKAHFLRVTGKPLYLSDKVKADTAIRRDVRKLKTVALSALSPAISGGLVFRGHASMRLQRIQRDVLDLLGLDWEIVAEERAVAKIETLKGIICNPCER